MPDPTPAGDARIAQALRDLMALIDDGLLQRNTVNDHHFPTYLAESTRIVTAIKAAQDAIALADALEVSHE